jgi:hypothetical protein
MKNVGQIIKDSKGRFWYVSKYRKMKDNPLWLGPFPTECLAIAESEMEEKATFNQRSNHE